MIEQAMKLSTIQIDGILLTKDAFFLIDHSTKKLIN